MQAAVKFLSFQIKKICWNLWLAVFKIVSEGCIYKTCKHCLFESSQRGGLNWMKFFTLPL